MSLRASYTKPVQRVLSSTVTRAFPIRAATLHLRSFATGPTRPLAKASNPLFARKYVPIAARQAKALGSIELRKMAGSNQLKYADGPMIWVDCEMTGLNVDTDRIIEIAVIITNGRLEAVDEGIEYVIQTPKEVLDGMDEWCTNQHGKSGLTDACIDSPHTYEEVSKAVLEYIQKWVPDKGAGLLAGSSVHADMRFLYKGMPEVMKHLSYRIVDVSSVKELCRRWYPNVRSKELLDRKTESSHRALDDIKGSIRELKFYQQHIFIPLEPEASDEAAAETVEGNESAEAQPFKTAL